jgi:hypothetical protein
MGVCELGRGYQTVGWRALAANASAAHAGVTGSSHRGSVRRLQDRAQAGGPHTGRGWARGGVGVFLLVALCACSAARQSTAALPKGPCRNELDQQRLRALLVDRPPNLGPDSDYIIGAGDLLSVTIYNYRAGGGDFVSDVRVDDRGYISLPMIDPIRIAGSSLARARRDIVLSLRRSQVLHEPLVSVFLKDYRGQQIVVIGAVSRPGIYPLTRGKQTLVDVVSLAGGLAPNAANYLLLQPAGAGASGSVDVFAASLAASTAEPAERDESMVAICVDGSEGGTNPALAALTLRGGDRGSREARHLPAEPRVDSHAAHLHGGGAHLSGRRVADPRAAQQRCGRRGGVGG